MCCHTEKNIGVAIALNVSPGPDVLYIITKTITGGKKIGFASPLGVCKSSDTKFNISKKQTTDTFWKVFRQVVLIDILNPKVAIFFMAFLPQFVREGHGSVPFQFIYLGIIIILLAIVIEGIYILFASTISTKLRENEKYSIWMDRMLGTMF